jgi:DNA invertase Pin-like site-specific DNA recombinase
LPPKQAAFRETARNCRHKCDDFQALLEHQKGPARGRARGRSTAELLTIEADLSKRGIGLLVLSMGGERLDTRNPTSKLMLTILAGVATWEREIMLERQREGIAAAKAAGKYKGRPVSIDATEVKALAEIMGPAAIAKKLGIARSSVYRMPD